MKRAAAFLPGLIWGLGFVWSPGTSQTSEDNIISTKNFDKYGSQGYADTWAWVAPDGHEYAILLPATGTSIVDLETTPYEEINFIPGSDSWWHDVKTYKNYVYSVADQGNQGIQIIDMSSLPDFVGLTKTWYGDDGGSISQVHNLYIDTTRAIMYATGQGTRNIHIISIADPLNPKTIGNISGETHDMCVSGDGKMLVQATGRTSTLSFWDISDPESPQFLTTKSIGSGYSHQCWFHDDNIHMSTTIETTGEPVKFWDVSPVWESEDPILLDEWMADPSIIAHNVHYEGDVLYVAHYTAGIWMLDVSDHSDVKVLAHHDPSTSSSTYAGTWGVYPWLPSGRVVHTDGQRGLYVVEPDPEIVPVDGIFNPVTIGALPKTSGFFSVVGALGNQILLDLEESGRFRGKIFNSRGQGVHSFLLDAPSRGKYTLESRASASGIYFIELSHGGRHQRQTFGIEK